jgi:hypothetical protein
MALAVQEFVSALHVDAPRNHRALESGTRVDRYQAAGAGRVELRPDFFAHLAQLGTSSVKGI